MKPCARAPSVVFTLVLSVVASWSIAAPAASRLLDVRLDPCVQVNAAEVDRLIAIELEGLGAGGTPLPRGVRVPVVATCQDGHIRLRLDDPLTDKALERPLRLEQAAPQARARLLALAVVELLVASWTELEATPPPAPAASAADVSAAQRIALQRLAPPPPKPSVALAGLLGAFHASGSLGLAWAAGVRALFWTPGQVGTGADLRLDQATGRTELGRVRWESVSLTPVVFWGAERSRGRLRAGLMVRAGWARLQGEPTSTDVAVGSSFSAPWLAPGAQVAVGWSPHRRLLVELGAEGGWVAVPMGGRVDGVRRVAVEGGFFGGTVSVGALF